MQKEANFRGFYAKILPQKIFHGRMGLLGRFGFGKNIILFTYRKNQIKIPAF
jgi:hypothetical protein